MFSCLGRLGCLVLILIALVVGWLTRERWQPMVFGDRGSPTVAWEPLSPSGSDEVVARMDSMARGSGPAYVTLSASQLASLMVQQSGYGLPDMLDSVFAAVDGDRVLVRAEIPLDQIRGLDALGPLGGLLGGKESIELGGMLSVVKPGLGAFRITSVSVADIPVPQAAIPALLARLDSLPRPEGVSDDALAVTIPEWIGDVRIANGAITVYRRTP